MMGERNDDKEEKQTTNKLLWKCLFVYIKYYTVFIEIFSENKPTLSLTH